MSSSISCGTRHLTTKITIAVAQTTASIKIDDLTRVKPSDPHGVVVPKQSDEIRLCVDMRRANEAIIRERYPIPTVD